MTIIRNPGFHAHLSPSAYFAEPCPTPALNASTISILNNQCPAKAAYGHPAIDQPVDERTRALERYMLGSGVGKPAQALGGVVHRLALGKGASYTISPYDEYRTKEAKEWRDEQAELGIIALKQKQFDQASSMAEVMRHNIEVAAQGHPYETELVIAWQENTPSGPIWLRGMLDAYVPALNLIIDVKTAASITDDAIDRAFNGWGYARQSTFYRRGVDAILGKPGESRFDFLFVENEAPWLSRRVNVSEGFRSGSEQEIERAIGTWGKCLATGEWPGYGDRTVVPKPWTVKSWMEAGIDVEMEVE